MNLKLAALAALPALLVACSAPPAGSGGNSGAVVGYSSQASWTDSSYDPQGFPIFGYAYGCPVYGYAEDGRALFSADALESGCCVPQWAPAPWYQGGRSYPSGVRRAAAPARYPKGHHPGRRPEGGVNARIHRDPGAVFGWRKPRPNPLPDIAPPTLDPDFGKRQPRDDDDRDDDRDSLDEWRQEQERREQWERDQHHRHKCGHKHKDKNHDCKHHR